MDDLMAFLTARLDEDEERAKGCPSEGRTWPRALREVEAKRAILGIHDPMPSMYGEPPVCSACWPAPQIATHPLWPCSTIRHLTAVWSDHPDYRPEWKP